MGVLQKMAGRLTVTIALIALIGWVIGCTVFSNEEPAAENTEPEMVVDLVVEDTPEPEPPTATSTVAIENTPTPEPSNTPTSTETQPPPTATAESPDEVSVEDLFINYDWQPSEDSNIKIFLYDDLNDSFGCRNGQPLNRDTPALFDIIGIGVATIPDPNGSENPAISIDLITEERWEDGKFRSVPLVGAGVELTDPRIPLIENPDWILDTMGTRGFNLIVDPSSGDLIPYTALLEDGQWNRYAPAHRAEILPDGVWEFEIPHEWVVGTINPIVTITDGEQCDGVLIPAETWSGLLINDPPAGQRAALPENPEWPSDPERFEPADNYMEGGSFSNSTVNEEGNAVRFNFVLNGEVDCPTDKIKLVNVFHVREDRKPEEILEDYTPAATDGYLNPSELTLMFNKIPVDPARSINGIHVDTVPRIVNLSEGGFTVNQDPKYPNSDVKETVITGHDAPAFLKDGYTAYFETAVVCELDDGSIKVLGSMRWGYRGSPSRVWLIRSPGGEIDWGPATQGLVDSVQYFKTGQISQ